MLRPGSLPFLLAAVLSPVLAGAAEARKPTPTPTPAPKASAAPARPKDAPKRVFTNDDLEAGRDKPSNVQDLSATGAVPWQPPPDPPPDAQDEPSEPKETRTAAEIQIAELTATIKSLDEQANQLLWAYLQSTDTNEILRLKAEQQEVLDRKKEVEAELARVRAGGGAESAPTPTREPG